MLPCIDGHGNNMTFEKDNVVVLAFFLANSCITHPCVRHMWLLEGPTYFLFQLKFICIGLQLQLQRNEVIALMNLLSRLSESVKFVYEMGPSAEIEAQVSAPISPSCPLQRMWASMFNRPAPNCPLRRMWKSISDTPPPSCPLQRIWASING